MANGKALLGDYVFQAKYAKYNKELNRRESWPDSVKRMMDMHREKFKDLGGGFLSETIDEIEKAIIDKKISGSQRALQFGGDAITEKNMRIYNCVVSHCDRTRFFDEMFWLLLCGCGAGFSVQRHHVNQLPSITRPKNPYYHPIEDSIEGWAKAVRGLVTAYTNPNALKPRFDYTSVRPRGASLRHGGKAPGPEPLKEALEAIEVILEGAVGRKLKTIECFDMSMFLADAVISGGIRRSATIAVFDIDDEDMVTAKTGNWFIDNPQRGRANISAVVSPEVTEDQFKALFESTKQFGEPGFVFMDSKEWLFNPCVEICMAPVLIEKDGSVVKEYTLDLLDFEKRESWIEQGYSFKSGWQACNLSTINCSNVHTPEEYFKMASLASVLGTFQAAYTDAGYLGEVSQKIIERESLLGVSMTGVMENPELFLDPNNQRQASMWAANVNQSMSQVLRIPPASRITCIKPEGTASIVLGTCAGIHPHHAHRYLRRVQANKDEAVYQYFEKHNPEMVEDSVWGADKVIAFPVEVNDKAIVKADMGAIEFLDKVKSTQKWWIESNEHIMRSKRLEGASHNVSVTASVKDDEWEAVADYLWANRDSFSGVSLLSDMGDAVYDQAPLEEVFEPSMIADDDPHREKKLATWEAFNRYKEVMKPVDYTLLFEAEDNTDLQGEVACAGGECSLEYRMDKENK